MFISVGDFNSPGTVITTVVLNAANKSLNDGFNIE